MPPLILHVVHHLVIGGMENGLVNLINRMPKNVFRHAILCVEDYSDFRQRLVRSDVEVFPMYRSRIGISKLRLQIFRLCRLIKPTVLHSRNMSGLDALLPAKIAGVRHCIHGEHGWDMNDLRGNNWKPILIRRLHSPLIDRYITVSKHLRNYLINKIGVGSERITQIYNGVDTDRFVPSAEKPRGVLPLGFLNDDSVVIGTIGRLQPIKNQEMLLRAFAVLAHGNFEFSKRLRLIIAGNGPQLTALHQLAGSLGITPLMWMPGAVSNVHEILQSMDIFVLPSLAEGISNTVLEAMATGLPVIATRVGGNIELVRESETGFLFEPNDIQVLTQLLINYISNTSLRKRHADQARGMAVNYFSLSNMVVNYQKVYEKICA